MAQYDHLSLEAKWQKFWEENKSFKTENDFSKPKHYCLDMFPYPSGAGLHVGHPKGFVGNDIYARYKHTTGYNILHPMGWDAFGLPAENYAIKTGVHPRITTDQNIANYKRQLKSLGLAYDWDREVDTTDPEYYKWTQWIFLKMFEAGLAYEQDLPINYCPSCKTGLANEEVNADHTCDRCGTLVEKRKIRQWVLAITKYAERLLADVDTLDWPEGIKEMQRNWIGKSEGCEFEMKLALKYAIGTPNEEEFQQILEIRVKNKSNAYKFSREQFVVARDNGKVIGFARTRTDETSGKTELGALYIDENYRGKKLGYELMNYLIDQSSAQEFYLDCAISLEQYYLDFGCEKLESAEDFQIEKLRNIYTEYGLTFTSETLQESTFFKFVKTVKRIPSIRVYTTRIDTVYGMTYAVMAPDHRDVELFITPEHRQACESYIASVKSKSDQDRTNESNDKTGVFTGSHVINPYNGESVPLWIADYVLGHYGTGTVMAVPAHDERDFAFAKKYHIPMRQSLCQKMLYTGENAARSNVDTLYRKVVDAIIENEQGQFLMICNQSPTYYHFVGGGIEEGETELDAIKREILEETGYTDFEIIGYIPGTVVGSLGYRSTKNKNQDCLGKFFHIKLTSENRIHSEVEEGKHKMQWCMKEEVTSLIVEGNHSYAWDILLHGMKCFSGEGVLVNSGEFDGLSSSEARKVLTEKAEKEGFGEKKVNYKLRDWLFSRQRYWGEPIPLIHISNEDYNVLPRSRSSDAWIDVRTEGEFVMIADKEYSKVYDGINSKIIIDWNLPLELPQVEKYEPAGDGQSPLATVPEFVHVEIAKNLAGKRETNTMPQWGGSCWYYLRYMDPKNSQELVAKDVVNYWGEVDSYVGGAEHAVLHLLYARFWHKFLYDIGVVPTIEPFARLRNQGMILAYAYERSNGGLVAVDLVEERDGKFFEIETGLEVKRVIAKMSKSLKNVVNPDDMINEYGTDALRMYEMVLGDFRDSAPWEPTGIVGVRRFLDRVHTTFTEGKNLAKDEMKTMKLLHKTVKKVGEDIEDYKFNTAISSLMILLNEGLPTDSEFQTEWKEKFAILLHPFAPHMAEEIWHMLPGKGEMPEGQRGLAGNVDTEYKPPVSPLSGGGHTSIYHAEWPSYDEWMLIDDEVTIAVQVNGKLRGTFTFLNGVAQEEVAETVYNSPDITKWIEGKEIAREIFVPNKLFSIVVKQ